MANEDTKVNGWLSGTIIVAVGTVLAYLFTYRYETGYADVFGIPYEFISIDLAMALRIAILIIGLLWTIYPVANLIAIFLPKNDHPMYNALIYYSVIACYTILIMLLFRNLWKEWLPYVIGFIIILIIELVWPLLTIRGKKSYTEKFIESQEHEAPGFFRSLPGRFFMKIGIRGFWLIWGLVMFYSIIYKAGESSALHKKDFYLYGDKSQYAVVAIYDDVLIFANYDVTAKEIYNKYMITKLGENPISLTLRKNIGPLKIKDSPDTISNNQ